jgi:hypothetical protein
MKLGILHFAEVNLTMPNGNPLYKVRVVTEQDGTLVTAFPQLNWR